MTVSPMARPRPRPSRFTATRNRVMEARAAVDETEFCHSAAPPSPFIWRFNTDGEGVSALSRQRLGANSNVYYLHGTWMTASFSTVAGAKLAGSAVMFAGALSPSLLKHLLKGEGGGCSRMTVKRRWLGHCRRCVHRSVLPAYGRLGGLACLVPSARLAFCCTPLSI